jgi:hypothetical protein
VDEELGRGGFSVVVSVSPKRKAAGADGAGLRFASAKNLVTKFSKGAAGGKLK